MKVQKRARRVLAPWIFALYLLVECIPATAQINLKQLLTPDVRRGIQTLGRTAQDVQSGRLCDQLKQWISSVPAASLGRTGPEMMPLLDDALFSKYFSKTYDQLTADDFRGVQSAQQACQKQGGWTTIEQNVTRELLTPSAHQRIARLVESRRAQRTEIAGLVKEIDGLQANEHGWARLEAIAVRSIALAPALTNDEQRQVQERLTASRQRIGVEVYGNRIREAAASASGAQGIATLLKLRTEVAAVGLPENTHATMRQTLNTRIAEIFRDRVREEISATESAQALEMLMRLRVELSAASLAFEFADPLQKSLDVRISEVGARLAQAERAKAPLRVADRQTLEQSLAWIGDFDRRYSTLSGQPALADVRREVMAARQGALAANQEALISSARASRTVAETNTILQKYLHPEETRQSPGAQIQQAASERAALLLRISRDQAIFGPQPEHQALLNPIADGNRTQPQVANQPVTRCDQLAAHPDDPGRVATGVSDEELISKAKDAVTACIAAVKAQPKSARLRFQLARALIEADQTKEGLAELQRAAQMNHGGAHHFLSVAYDSGVPGILPKNTTRSREAAKRAVELGFTLGAGSSSGERAGQILADNNEVKTKFEDPRIMRAIYYGDSSLLPTDKVYAQAYLLAQVRMLASECNSFRLTEVREMQQSIIRAYMPSNQSDMARMGLEAGLQGLQIIANMISNPQSIVGIAAQQQRLEDAPEFGAKDLGTFSNLYNARCGSAPLERYTKNLRSFFGGSTAGR